MNRKFRNDMATTADDWANALTDLRRKVKANADKQAINNAIVTAHEARDAYAKVLSCGVKND